MIESRAASSGIAALDRQTLGARHLSRFLSRLLIVTRPTPRKGNDVEILVVRASDPVEGQDYQE
jgi:hypothetical protein